MTSRHETTNRQYMTPQQVRARVAAIDPKGDAGTAHATEDQIWLEVLNAIACGAPNPQALAFAAVATDALEFERWYA